MKCLLEESMTRIVRFPAEPFPHTHPKMFTLTLSPIPAGLDAGSYKVRKKEIIAEVAYFKIHAFSVHL